MNFHLCLPWRRRRPGLSRARTSTPAWVTAGVENAAAPDQDAPPLGCGWFDSSHELHAGLQVTEYLSPEPVADSVPLGWWLDWQSGAGGESASGRLRLR